MLYPINPGEPDRRDQTTVIGHGGEQWRFLGYPSPETLDHFFAGVYSCMPESYLGLKPIRPNVYAVEWTEGNPSP